MKKRIIAKRLFGVICTYSLVSLAIILIPIFDLFPQEIRGKTNIVIGLMFWIGLVGGIIAYFRLYKKCSSIISEVLDTCLPPGLSFFSNEAALFVDIVLIISVIANILFIILFNPPVFIDWLGIFVLVTSFYLHFLLNGRVFKYIIKK